MNNDQKELPETEMQDGGASLEEVVAEESEHNCREDELQQEISDLKDQLLRSMAEVENVRKRGQLEREQAHKFAISNFSKDLLTVADTLERALDTFKSEDVQGNEILGKILEGIQLTQQSLQKIFEQYDIKRLYPLNEKFDHNFHQAMFESESSDKAAGTVIQVLQAGYILHERLLRPAMVGVSK